MEKVKILSELFTKKYNCSPTGIERLPGAGSGRKYFRLYAGAVSCIGVVGENIRDCRAFVELSCVFKEAGIMVPEVYDVSADGLCYLQEDFGDISLFDVISKIRKENDSLSGAEEAMESYVGEALCQLARMQCVPYGKWVDAAEYAPFSRRQIFWDLNYFKYEYLRPAAIDFDEEALENDFERFAGRLMKEAEYASGFMYRDFQSRNVMIVGDRCGFIDYQGGRKGPSLYDAVSFLWQAKAKFSKEFREKMLSLYADEYCGIRGIDKNEFLSSTCLFALFRTLQVLGAYGLRGLVERKAHFLESIPAALDNLSELISEGVLDEYPELLSVSKALINDLRFKNKGKKGDPLTVEVFSFSYKKGYPADFSGNGGGFMFDCRGMHNPGRYEEYKKITGLDEPVIKFLQEKGETDLFSLRAFELVEPTVARYKERGFTNLQIGFGCTGGQHRSVYCAEKVSKMLAERFPEVHIKVNHREQGISKTYNFQQHL